MGIKLFSENNIHRFFVITLVLKGIFAALEIIGGIGTFFVTRSFLLKLIQPIVQAELAEDPRDFIANHLLRWAENFSVGIKLFAAIYLLVHGVVKLWLIVGLLRERLWYYPVALLIFGAFIVYQMYRYSYTQSIMLIFITFVDLVVIVLTWHEFRYLQNRKETD